MPGIPERLVHHRAWLEIGSEVVHKARPRLRGVVEAVWTDHKIAQEFAQVLWDDGSRDVVPTDQLDMAEEFEKRIWQPSSSPRKEYMIRRSVPKDEIDIVELRAILESQGFSDAKIKEYLKHLNKADVYETVEGWKIFETADKKYVLKGKQLIEEK